MSHTCLMRDKFGNHTREVAEHLPGHVEQGRNHVGGQYPTGTAHHLPVTGMAVEQGEQHSGYTCSVSPPQTPKVYENFNL